MECIRCGESGFHRVVVEVQSGETVGGLCESCDDHRQSNLTEPVGAVIGRMCSRCPQPARIAIPLIDCEIEGADGDTTVEYDLSPETPQFCYECVPLPELARTQPVPTPPDGLL